MVAPGQAWLDSSRNVWLWFCCVWHDEIGIALKSKGNYEYSEAVMATWQREAGRTDGVTHSNGIADMYCHSVVKTADGGVLPS